MSTGKVKGLAFTEGTTVSGPSDLTISASGLANYASDAAYVTAKGSAAAAGDIYFNTVDAAVKEYDGTTWRHVVTRLGTETLANKTLTSPVLNTPSASGGITVVEGSAPSSPSAGNLAVYAKTDDKLYTKNSAGIETQVGSGSGGKNYLASTSNTAAGWTASGAGITVATTSTAAELPRDQTTQTGIKFTPVSGTAYAYARFTLDAVDAAGMPQLVTWAQKPASGYASGDLKVDVYTNTASNYGGTYTRVPLTTDSSSVSAIPNLTGQYQTKFIPATTPLYYEIRITRVAGTTALVISDVSVGPQAAVTGAPPSDWVTVASYTQFTNAAITSPTTNVVKMRRVGDTAHFRVIWGGGTATVSNSNNVTWNLPTGMTIDTTKVASTTREDVVGYGTWYNGTTAHVMLAPIYLTSTTLVFLKSGGASLLQSDLATGHEFRADFILPIAEWAGAGGVVNLVQADCEYAYNTSTANSSDTTSFGYGQSGGAIGSFTASVLKRVRFKTPIQPTDTLIIEVQKQSGSSPWIPMTAAEHQTGLSPLQYQGSKSYGIGFNTSGINSTDVDVAFGDYGYANNATTYSAAGAAWSNWTGWNWRVKKLSGGAVAGVAEGQPGVAAGLVGYYGTKGRVDGVTVPAGYVGEIVESFQTALLNAAASGSLRAMVSVTLTPGVWDITTTAIMYRNGAAITSPSELITAISSTSASSAGTTYGYDYLSTYTQGLTADQNIAMSIPRKRVNITTTTTYYTNVQVNYTSGTPQWRGYMSATRVA